MQSAYYKKNNVEKSKVGKIVVIARLEEKDPKNDKSFNSHYL